MNAGIIAVEDRNVFTSPGGGTTEECSLVTVEYDGEVRPTSREVERLAETYMADRNGYVGRITSVYHVEDLSPFYGGPDVYASKYSITIMKEW